jgi:hypothetical protein
LANHQPPITAHQSPIRFKNKKTRAIRISLKITYFEPLINSLNLIHMDDLKIIKNDGSPATISGSDLEAFKMNVRGGVLLGGDKDYDEVRTIWNGMHDKKPALIARCSGVADVIAAVNFARDHKIMLAVRGGGHNVGGSASCDGGIMIDLSTMIGVWVDPNNRTVRAQGGATWGDVDRETQVFGLPG